MCVCACIRACMNSRDQGIVSHSPCTALLIGPDSKWPQFKALSDNLRSTGCGRPVRLCSPEVSPPPPRAQKCGLFCLRCDHPCLFAFPALSWRLPQSPAAVGCSYYSEARLIAAGLQGDNGGKISFSQKSSQGEGGTDAGGVCHSCRRGQRDTNDVNLFVLVGDVYNFQACIYPKNSLPSTLSPLLPWYQWQSINWLDQLSIKLQSPGCRARQLSCSNALYFC